MNDIKIALYPYYMIYLNYLQAKLLPDGANDLFQTNTDLFSTRALIWLHFKTVHYFSKPIFSLFSY